MRIWVVGGGTGGHIYPALAVVQALRAGETDPAEVLYVGAAGGIEEELVPRAGVRLVTLPGGGLHGLSPLRAMSNLFKLAQGFAAALRLARAEPPSALLVTGGYSSVSAALAAWMRRVPILVYLPDVEPGQAIRFLARLATRVAVTVEDSRRYLPARKVVVTGYPVRQELVGLERAAARAALGIATDASQRVVLVFGGSRGARSLNRAVMGALDEILELAEVIHVSGRLDWDEVERFRAALSPERAARYHAYPYLHEMGLALAAADLAVCRAGASVLGEFPLFGLPAVLVPYPYAWRYQKVNADWLVERGAAVCVEDAELPAQLVPLLRRLLSEPGCLEAMSERAAGLAQPDAAARLATELRGLARHCTGNCPSVALEEAA